MVRSFLGSDTLMIRDKSDAVINSTILDLSVCLGFYTYTNKTIHSTSPICIVFVYIYIYIYINEDCAPNFADISST